MASALALSAAQAQLPQGDAAAGERRNAMCVGCHGVLGYKTGFPEVHRVPKIFGQSAQYIEAALTAYQNGERKHPSMRAIAQTLSPKDIADLAAYYSGQRAASGSRALSAAEAEAAKALIDKGGCLGCHGPGMNKPVVANYPKVAGQHGDYLLVALKSYKSEKPAFIGRSNPIMGGVVKQFSDAQLRTLANYIESLPGELNTFQPSRFR